MYLLIVSALFLCLSIYFITKANCSDWLYLMSRITAILAAVTLFISTLAFFFIGPKEIVVFEQQKAYIETHIPKSDIEDAAITSKKVELNDWLYEAQFSKKIFGGWSEYSDKVLELEPIE